MIRYGWRDIFEVGADLIVNPVNSQVHRLKPGYQKGLAGEFERRFPAIQPALRDACARGLMRPGRVQLIRVDRETGLRDRNGDLLIANVATKDHWRDPSRIEWVRTGIEKLAQVVRKRELSSIAIPQLGAGLGGLDWADVQREVHAVFAPLAREGVEVMVLGEDVLGLSREEVADSGKSVIYAGIGARDTPPEVCRKMTDVARIMARNGAILRSGGAAGADDAFEKGAAAEGGKREIYLPSERFNGRVAGRDGAVCDVRKEHMDLAARYHPAWSRLSGFVRKLMARNSAQCLGADLSTPADVIICYTDRGEVRGGTGQALRMAADLGIPIINLGSERWRGRSATEIAGEALRLAGVSERGAAMEIDTKAGRREDGLAM